MKTSTPHALEFLHDGGEAGELMRTQDWSRLPLGPPELWPQALRTVVSLMLSSKFPMFTAWGPELGFLYNDPYAEILGTKHPSAMGRRFQDIWGEVWDDIHPIIKQAMAGKASYHENLPLTLNRKDFDEQTWFTFSYSPVRDENGDVAGMFCVVTETTEQVLAERHRAEEHERLRHLFQQAPGIIAYTAGPSHVFELANDAYLRLVGKCTITGKSVREALPELEGQGFFELLDLVYTTGEPYVGHEVLVKLRRQPWGALDERYVNFIYQPTRDHRGNVSGIFVEGSDVTDAVRTNQALRESEQRLRQLANTIPQLAWMANPDGVIHWYNDRWYEYTGVAPEQMEGLGWRKVYHPKNLPDILKAWKTSIATGSLFEATFPLRGADGEYRTFFTRAAPLRDATGNIVQWFGTNTDVTASETAQNELKEANRRKDEFLAMLAHELRNPLAPIATAAELLKLATLDEERVRQTSKIISRQVNHMTELVDDLLDVSRVTRGLVTLQEETLNLGSLVADAVEQTHSLMEIKHHEFAAQVPDEQLLVRGDRTRLIQVFSNILNNAARYTPPGGRIVLSLKGDASHVSIEVEDNGIGIEARLLPHIFELFTQAERSPDRSQGGLGLGLALVKSLVELQGGSVTARSAGSGKGSCFTVRLPRLHAARRTREHPARQIASRLPDDAKEMRVLVVDDNEDAAQTLSLLLEAAGYQVCAAHGARDALETAVQLSPDILFLDIGLPDMDGYELARRLRAMPESSDSLLVALTGYGQPQDRTCAMQAGFDHHLVKPVKLDEMLKVLAASNGRTPHSVVRANRQ